jgi:DNA replication regulator SLD3
LQKNPSGSFNQSKARPPSLIRSATDSQAIPRLKREASELSTSLFDISPAKPATRGTSVQLKHLQSRQIDLNALTIATEKKLKQKAKIEEELKGAINTLKKPNRGLAVKEYVEETEQRSLGSTSMRKKTAGPIRKILHNVDNVQVTATPRHKRTTTALLPTSTKRPRLEDHSELHPPSSGDFCVPSSTVRPSSGGRSVFNRPLFSGEQNEAGTSVVDTPSRGRSKTVSFGDSNKQSLFSSLPISRPAITLSQQDAIGQAPSRSSSRPLHFPSIRSQHTVDDTVPQTPSKSERMEKKGSTIFATPQKPNAAVFATPQKLPPRNVPATVPQTPDPSKTEAVSVSVELEDGKNIYDALGWNDFDELL